MSKEYEQTALKRIGSAMAIAMKERGYGKDSLASESGVSKTIIYKILRGENYEITSLIRVMRVLQIHIELSLMSADNNIHTMGGNAPGKN